MNSALVLGGGGFIGGHLVRTLRQRGVWVRGVDLVEHDYFPDDVDEFTTGDLRDPVVVADVLDQPFNQVFQLAADMGGAGFIFTGENDAEIMHNSALINLNVAEQARRVGAKQVFYSSSACIYPERNQLDPNRPVTAEDSAYPAAPDSEYGWEKLFSERLWMSFARNYEMDVRIARFHNVFGPYGTWDGGREKAPAAICRKVAAAPEGGNIEIWGDGEQTRSFLYIDECLEGVERLMSSRFAGPVNIGSSEMVSINQLTEMVIEISGKSLGVTHVDGPLGVRGRNSDNSLISSRLGWRPSQNLREGLAQTYSWIAEQVALRDERNSEASKEVA